MVNIKLNVKKAASLLGMLTILIIFVKTLPIGNMVFLGIGTTLLHIIRNYRFAGWISAIACPVLYILSAAIDTPEASNLYVYYFFSYVVVIMICCIVEEHRILSNKSCVE